MLNHTLKLSGSMMACCILVFAGCAPTAQRTTLYTAEDVEVGIGTLVEELRDSPWLAQRSRTSPELRLMLGTMENRSNSRLSRLDQNAMVMRVMLTPVISNVLAEKNVRIFMPPADAKALEPFGITPREQWVSANPTHAVNAIFNSASRAGSLDASRPADQRKDLYLITMMIADVNSREQVWVGTAEFARTAKGTLVD
jgi:hypothetical protein